MRETNHYDVSIRKTIAYMEEHLDETLEIETLAKVSGYSPYHFCRIFKQVTGESPISMTQRLRMEQSVKQLWSLNKPITSIALENGYNTHSSFNKVFKQTFGQTPSQYRKQSAIRLQTAKQQLMNMPEIVTLESHSLICHREYGEYGAAALSAWSALFEKLAYFIAETNTELNIDTADTYAFCYDLPTITDEEKMRYEAGLDVSSLPNQLPEPLYVKQTPQGRYVKLTHTGSYESLYQIWPQYYGWIQENNLSLANHPPMERYVNDIRKLSEGIYETPVTELYLLLGS